MIHHISISAQDPQHVARILSEIFNGRVNTFGPLEGAFMVWFGDEFGSAVEVYPATSVLKPGEGREPCTFIDQKVPTYGGVHAAISVACDRQFLLAIGERENWRCIEQRRGSFSVMEFWLENSFMLELLTEDMQKEYLQLSAKYKKV